jgi:hypothetical protein
VPLVSIARSADATSQLYAAALLHDMRGLVRDREQISIPAEHDMVPGCNASAPISWADAAAPAPTCARIDEVS